MYVFIAQDDSFLQNIVIFYLSYDYILCFVESFACVFIGCFSCEKFVYFVCRGYGDCDKVQPKQEHYYDC